MRIISGTAKATKLDTLKGENTRPTLDRVKESLFNIIQNEIEDSIVLDLFSGSGAIGLEFASRGARKVFLNDGSKEAFEIIKHNIEKTHLSSKVEAYNLDFINMIEKTKNQKFNIIYLDPPYKSNFIIQAINEILKFKMISNDSLIIIETDEDKRIIENLNKIDNIKIIDKRKYGRAYIFFLKENKH